PDATLHEVIDDPSDGILGTLFDLLGEGHQLLAPDPMRALRKAGFAEAARLSTTSKSAVAAVYPAVSKALAGPTSLLYSSPDLSGDVRVLLSSPPVILIGAEIAAIRGFEVTPAIDPVLRFGCGRIVEL